MMKPPFAVLAVCLVIAAGCHKKAAPGPGAESAAPESAFAPANPGPDVSGTPAPTAAPAAAPTPITPLPPPPKYLAANADNTIRQRIDGEPDAMMTGLLRSFVQKNGRMPQNFYEFSLKGMDTIPRPPEGKRWAIDATDMQVKAVPAK
jgi:hypothetical protein